MRKKILQVQKKKGGGETLSLARSLSPSLALSEAGGLPSHPTPPPNLSLLPGSASFQPQANQCLQVTSEAGEALQEGGGGDRCCCRHTGGGGALQGEQTGRPRPKSGKIKIYAIGIDRRAAAAAAAGDGFPSWMQDGFFFFLPFLLALGLGRGSCVSVRVSPQPFLLLFLPACLPRAGGGSSSTGRRRRWLRAVASFGRSSLMNRNAGGEAGGREGESVRHHGSLLAPRSLASL